MTLTVRLSMLAAAAVMAGCATQTPPAAAPAAAATPATTSPAAAAPAAAAQAKEFYAVLPEDGRIYAFGDTKNYKDYQAHGEVTLTRTKIGEGPGGKTLVFGITPDDVKTNKPSLGEQVMSGALAPAPDFYGEVFKAGRYFIFGNLKDMKDFIAFGEVPYSYTDIGAGPQGETLVFVMNKDSYAKGKPQDRIERFKALRVAAK
ncbi:MAG: hypothetical protein Q7U73_11410 [Rubrivivax sp.]|nr:hypothetical protein [Rubrivivax sp.]